MKFCFNNKKISAILTIIPRNFSTFDDEMLNYSGDLSRTKLLKKVMGYEKHHFVEQGVCCSDLAVFGMEHLFHKGLLQREDIDALILVTQSPDFFMPATSNVIQGRLGLEETTFCLDINQGCAGYLVGLIQAFALLDQPEMNKVVLINADVLSRKVSREDRNSFPLIGDAASISIIECSQSPTRIEGEIRMDGTRGDVLKIPAGGFRLPCTAETARLQEYESGNRRSLDNLVMMGREVFTFVQEEMPKLLNSYFKEHNIDKNSIDWYLFHQPNKFMLDKLAEAIDVPYKKMPSNIVAHFGNASGVTIPTNISFNLGRELLQNSYQVCLAGFGVGLTWGLMLLELGKLQFCEMIEF